MSLEKRYNTSIIDVENLVYLTEKYPIIKDNLFEFLNIKSDNENNIRSVNFDMQSIFPYDDSNEHIPTIDSTCIGKGESLFQEYQEIKTGTKHFVQHEEKCTCILKYLFGDYLEGWYRQHRTDDELNRYDLVCKVMSDEEFWKNLKTYFQSLYIIFEFKNYRDLLRQTQIYTTEKYLFAKAFRNVAFIISRKGASINAKRSTDGILRESGKLIINLCDADLHDMLTLKDSGSNPTDYLQDLLDQKMIKLSK